MNFLPANPGSPSNSDGDPLRLGGNYRLSAAHSTALWDEPQGRVFCHNRAANGSYFIQEVIWKQNFKSYDYGSIFTDAVLGSHMAATINEFTHILHFFYTTYNITLQEVQFLDKSLNPLSENRVICRIDF